MDEQQLIPFEEWRPVPTWEGQYEISTFGRVRRVKALLRHPPGRILRGIKVHRDLYHGVWLTDMQRKEKWSIHVLVALVFIGPPPSEKHEINHKDGNKLNNHLSNLEWVTHRENIEHAYRTGLRSQAHLRCLTPPQADEVRQLIKQHVPYREIAERYGIGSIATITHVKQRKGGYA